MTINININNLFKFSMETNLHTINTFRRFRVTRTGRPFFINYKSNKLQMKPNLKAVFIDRGESFDAKQLANLDQWAKENDIQAFITIVDFGEVGEVENAIYIEEGEIVSS